jgi:hypothetical protein
MVAVGNEVEEAVQASGCRLFLTGMKLCGHGSQYTGCLWDWVAGGPVQCDYIGAHEPNGPVIDCR